MAAAHPFNQWSQQARSPFSTVDEVLQGYYSVFASNCKLRVLSVELT